MYIPFGIFSAAGAGGGGGGAGSYDLLESNILASAVASVTFSVSAYAATYKHLQIRMTSKVSSGTGTNDAFITFNSDSGSNYAWHRMMGNGSTVTSDASSSTTFMLSTVSPNDNSASLSWGAGLIDILDPYSTSKNKTIRTLSGQLDSSTRVQLNSGLWMSTAAVSSVIVAAGSGTWKAGSRFSIYGLKA